jgi:hypothetical protein
VDVWCASLPVKLGGGQHPGGGELVGGVGGHA